MREALSIGLFVGIGTGVVFGVINAVEGEMSRAVGPFNVSLLQNLGAGALSVIVVIVGVWRGDIDWGVLRGSLPLAGLVGVLVLASVTGIAFTIPRIGVAAGTIALIFGQVVITVVVDTLGIGGYEPIPLSLERIAGLLLLAAGTYLVLPRTE
jgi:transporter family-2 protein